MLANPNDVCVQRKSDSRCDPGVFFAVWYGFAAHCVGLRVQSLGCAVTGTMVILILRVLAERLGVLD